MMYRLHVYITYTCTDRTESWSLILYTLTTVLTHTIWVIFERVVLVFLNHRQLLHIKVLLTEINEKNIKSAMIEPALRRTSSSSPCLICKFLVSVLRLLLCISEACQPTTKAMNEKKDAHDDFKDGNKGFKDLGRRGCRRHEEPWIEPHRDATMFLR